MPKKPTLSNSAASHDSKRPKRGRPPTIDSEKLLEVARAVFLERGIRATTLEVAERAGVSEGAVFHRFKSKDVLFREAMRGDAESIPERIAATIESLDGLEVRDALVQLASTMLELGRIGIPLMMMSWSNPDCSAEHCVVAGPPEDHQQAMRALLKRFAGYFEARMAAGELRQMDGEIVARTLIGAVHHYCMMQIFFGTKDGGILPESTFVHGLVDLLLKGATPT